MLKCNYHECTAPAFADEYTLERHLCEAHLRLNAFKCDACEAQFSMRKAAQQHFRLYHCSDEVGSFFFFFFSFGDLLKRSDFLLGGICAILASVATTIDIFLVSDPNHSANRSARA